MLHYQNAARSVQTSALASQVLQNRPPHIDCRTKFEEYKVILRMNMDRPHATHPKLQEIVNYSHRSGGIIGNGSTAAAIRYEKMTGGLVCDKRHEQKGREILASAEKWLRNHPEASHWGRATAENVIKDLKSAFGE
jgi:hypothetical protein